MTEGSTERVRRTLEQLLTAAERQLWLEFDKSNAFTHRGVKGAAREGSIAAFLQAHLPARFGVTTGQAIDARDQLSTQLDLIIYDRNISAPLLSGTDTGDLVAAEALLAVVEAKSKLTKDHVEACCSAVASLSSLKPYGRPFLPPRSGGAEAGRREARCQYSVLAFDTDVGASQWASTEWSRLRSAAREHGAKVDRIERVAVLTRGLLIPPDAEAIIIKDEPGVLRDWFLHLTNFLVREAARRAPYDWSAYLPERSDANRIALEGNVGPRRARARARDEKQNASSSKQPSPRQGRSRRK